MIATWATGQAAPNVTGRHKPGTPRIWTVTMHLQAGEAKEKIVFHSKQKLPLRVLQEAVINVAMREFEQEHGALTLASWQAVAR